MLRQSSIRSTSRPDHHHRRLLEAFRPLMHFAQVERREVEDRGLLGDRAAVGEHGARVALQLDVVEEAERLVQLHQRSWVARPSASRRLRVRGWVETIDRLVVAFGQRIQHVDQSAAGSPANRRSPRGAR